MHYHFVGMNHFVEAAGAGVDPLVVNAARRQPALSNLASLLGQACDAGNANRPGIMDQARERLAALEIAAWAGRLMFSTVAHELGLPGAGDPAPSEPTKPARGRRKDT